MAPSIRRNTNQVAKDVRGKRHNTRHEINNENIINVLA
jgi:hypothetical protein